MSAFSQPGCYGAWTDHLGSWLHIRYDTAPCTAFGGTISRSLFRSANRVVLILVVGFAYGVPCGLPRAFLQSINPARASPGRWSKIPSACCVSAFIG